MNEKKRCKFKIACLGPCKRTPINTDGYCEKHTKDKYKCSAIEYRSGSPLNCQNQPTHECEHSGFLICGFPYCDKHRCKHHDSFF